MTGKSRSLIQAARRALQARVWFASNSPPDAPCLPLSYEEREHLKAGGLPHIVAWYAASLENQRYEYRKHPPFDEYACGVMASPHAPEFIKQDHRLSNRFPPCLLEGLGSALIWEPLGPPIKARPYSKVIMRSDILLPDGYAEWANSFVVVTSDFIREVAGHVPYWSKRVLLECKYERVPLKRECYVSYGWTNKKSGQVERFYIEKYPQGWIIEVRGKNYYGPDARVLANTFFGLPMLAPTLPQASRLARGFIARSRINFPIGLNLIYNR